MNFISETNKEIHREELVRMKHRRAIFEKSYNSSFKTLRDVYRARIPRYEREALVKLVSDICLHEIFFSSFDARGGVSDTVKNKYGSEAAFLYELYECARNADGGFLLIFSDGRRIDFYAGRDYLGLIEREMPILALDLEEHAYFYDCFFERDSYIKAALRELNISKI